MFDGYLHLSWKAIRITQLLKYLRMKMKNFILLFLLSWMLFISSLSYAQSGKIPPFRITQSNGKPFKAEDLPMAKPIIIIYFSPDCDHCENLTKELLKQAANFNKASIAMITFLPVQSVLKFVNKYKLNKYPNIYVGTEETSFFVKNYYRVTEMPFVALYTKSGDLVKSYSREVPLKDLSNRLNILK